MYVDSVHYELGVEMDSEEIKGIPAAIEAAKNANVTVLVMGLDQSQVSKQIRNYLDEENFLRSNLEQN